MCDFSGKLIAWLDREVPAEEAAAVERHLESCAECRASVDSYRRVSAGIEAYCDATLGSSARSKAPRWTPIALGAGAVAALLALFLAMPRTRIAPPAFQTPHAALAASSLVDATAAPVSVGPVHAIHRRRAATPVSIRETITAPVQNQDASLLSDEPMIQIAIPADEMYPPGAVPEGMHFVADLTIAADGSAERLRLRPRLAGFERRTTQP